MSVVLGGQPIDVLLSYGDAVDAELIAIGADDVGYPLGLRRDSIRNLERGPVPVDVV